MLDLQNNERGVAEKLRVSDSENDRVVADQLLVVAYQLFAVLYINCRISAVISYSE